MASKAVSRSVRMLQRRPAHQATDLMNCRLLLFRIPEFGTHKDSVGLCYAAQYQAQSLVREKWLMRSLMQFCFYTLLSLCVLQGKCGSCRSFAPSIPKSTRKL